MGESAVLRISTELRATAREPLSRRIQAYKTDIVEATGISKSGLHFILGGLAFVATSLLLIRFTPHWAWWAAGVTLSLALLLELVDWSDASLVGKRLTWGHSLKDILLTCTVAAAYVALRPLFDRLRR